MKTRSITVMILGFLLISCSMQTREMKTPEGKLLGYLTTYNASADTCGWANGAVIHDPDLKLREFRVVTTPGITCTIIYAGSIIGGAYLHGSSFPKNVGDSIDVDADASAKASSSSHSYIREHYKPEKKKY